MRRLVYLLVFFECQVLANDPNFVRSSSSKAITSLRIAENELHKNTTQATSSAIITLEQLCNETSFRRLQNDERYEIYRTLLLAYQKAKAYEKQQALTMQLLQDDAFRSYWLSLKVSLVHSFLAQDRLMQATELVQSLRSTPERRLSYQDREEIAICNSHLNKLCEQKLALAELHFAKGDYQQACSLYKNLYDISLKQHFPQTLSQQSKSHFFAQLTLRLCITYILQNDEKMALSLLTSHLANTASSHFLQGVIAKREGRIAEALELFCTCNPPSNASRQEAICCAMKLGQLSFARELVDPITDYHLLCLLEIEEQNFEMAEELIEAIEDDAAFHFLKGSLFYRSQKPDFACIHLEQAAQGNTRWQQEAKLLLGKTYLELSQKSFPEAEREIFFERAIHCFEELKDQRLSTMIQAESYFTRGSVQQIVALIKNLPLHDCCRYELMLMHAELTQQFDEVTKTEHRHEPLFPKALRLSASFEEAYQVICERGELARDFGEVRQIIEKLIDLKQEERALALLQDLEPRLPSKKLIEECHFLFLWALKSTPHLDILLACCNQFLDSYPASPFRQDALFFKGLTFWKRGEHQAALLLFEEAAIDSQHKDELLFFIATTKEKLGLDAKASFAELFTDYPESPYAAEGYFRYYPESAYYRQEVEAIAHLKKMPKPMHETLYGVLAGFYLASAMHQETPLKSPSDTQRRQLQEAIGRFDQAINQAILLLPTLPQSMKESLTRRLFEAKLERLQALFSSGSYAQVIQSADDLKMECQHRDLWQEASSLKARALMLEGKEALSREELANLLDYSKTNDCEAGEALIRALVELALYKSREEQYAEAESLLSKAVTVHSNSGKGASHELMLEILIAKSLLHQKKGEQDLAMMLLSSVINDESASSLRIQAMYLRAELYEQKGRRDLAFRQLQAAAKKGGEWGERCRQKLGDKYGYE